jgi:hypothetical protein
MMTARAHRIRSRFIAFVAGLVLLACVMLSSQPARP